MSFIGQTILWWALVLCFLAAALAAASVKLKIDSAEKIIALCKRIMAVAGGLCVICLVLFAGAFLLDDFSLAMVAQYSSRDLPFFYKLSAVWAGSPGSLLLWLVGMIVMFALWLYKTGIDNARYNAACIIIGSGVCLVFCGLLVFVLKPFMKCPVVVNDGAGLNPLLQNLWMITHPPLLFVGYSAFLIPFIITLAAVLTNEMKRSEIYNQIRRWTLLGICFLTMGIASGAKWSYVELGWGGYWAWDPVENASLLPWFVAAATLHSIKGIFVSEKFRLFSIVLAPVVFILSLVATFITRSGILQSVHSFGENAIFMWLLLFILICLLLWIYCSTKAAKITGQTKSKIEMFSFTGEAMLFWANIVFVATATIIVIATFSPIISRIFTGTDSGIVLRRVFYDRVIVAVAVALALLIGLVRLVELRKRRLFKTEFTLSIIAGVVNFWLIFQIAKIDFAIAFVLGVCCFACFCSLVRFVELKGKVKVGAEIAHIGILLLIISACFATNEKIVQKIMAKGESFEIGNYTISYDSFRHDSFGEITRVGPVVSVAKGNKITSLWPHNVISSKQQNTAEVAVRTGFLEDVYMTFEGVVGDGRVIVTAKLKPLMLWLWIGCVLIIAGFATACFEQRKIRRDFG